MSANDADNSKTALAPRAVCTALARAVAHAFGDATDSDVDVVLRASGSAAASPEAAERPVKRARSSSKDGGVDAAAAEAAAADAAGDVTMPGHRLVLRASPVLRAQVRRLAALPSFIWMASCLCALAIIRATAAMPAA